MPASIDPAEQAEDVLARLRLRATLTERASEQPAARDGPSAPSTKGNRALNHARLAVSPKIALTVLIGLAVVVAAACVTLVPTSRPDPPAAGGLELSAAGDDAALDGFDQAAGDPEQVGPEGEGETSGSGEEGLALTGIPVQPSPPAMVVVHVAGAVMEPGVVELPATARVTDAVNAAGGLRPEADLAGINLARPLVDGERIYLPVPGETPPAVEGCAAPNGPDQQGTAGGGGAGGDPGGGSGTGLVDINSADAQLLETLPGIGPVLAGRIVDHRDKHGPFPDVDALLDVSGIGAAILGSLRDLVEVR
ncbi:MAG: ComEA family DNA-binding protein [Bifidobacteriaceae bacterium]|jgi:competence protein ComEA|nr:ComEA family DNA-binding protein [Bifidobacteriaceae bacterium]